MRCTIAGLRRAAAGLQRSLPIRRIPHIYIWLLTAALPDPTEIVRFLDAARVPGEGVEIELTLTTIRGTSESRRRYRVLDNGAGDSIIEFLDPVDQGVKILATRNDLWFFAPRTHRAIRIPPAQRVFGDASYGDLARLRWHDDFEAAYDATREELLDGSICWRLRLSARSPAATYRTVLVWVRQSDWVPRRAAYFVASGKLLKVVEFPEARIVDGRLRNDVWILRTEGTPDHRTVLAIESVTPREFAAHQFTRRYLELHP